MHPLGTIHYLVLCFKRPGLYINFSISLMASPSIRQDEEEANQRRAGMKASFVGRYFPSVVTIRAIRELTSRLT
jgi:hypothetical protein